MTTRAYILALLLWSAGKAHAAAEDVAMLEMRTGMRSGCGEARVEFVEVHPDGSSFAAVQRRGRRV